MVRRARPVRERIVPTVVERLTREFKYPETDPGPQGVSILGAGGGAPTIVLAAANALDIEKAKADILCSGVNDEQFIQAAINSLLFGGRLLFTSGTFHINFAGSANCVATGGFSGITFEGMGTEATIFNVEDSRGGSSIDRFAFEFTDADIAVKNLTLQGGDGSLGATNGIALGNQSLASNVIVNTDGIGIQMSDGEIIVDGCQFLGGSGVQLWGDKGMVVNSHIDVTGDGIHITGVTDIKVMACDIDSSAGHAIHADQSINRLLIVGNTLLASSGFGVFLNNDDIGEVVIAANTIRNSNGGINAPDGAYRVTVANNQISTSPVIGSDAVIHFAYANAPGPGGYGLDIRANTIEFGDANGIEVSEYADVQIMGNQIHNIDGHGIALNDVSDSKVTGNLIVNIGGDGTNTFDGIILSGDSDGNLIDGNKVVPGPIVVPRYGINVSAATCDDNAVVGNDFSDPGGTLYGTARFNDAGTGTVTTWAGTFGDNID